MARKKCADLEKTKLKLLEVGLALFEENGFNATGIQEITESTGVPKGSFYNYFSSKEEFGVEVIRFYTESNIERWKQMLAEVEEDGAYEALGTALLLTVECYKCAEVKKGCLLGNLSAEISAASEECRIALQSAINEFKDLLTERLRIGQQTGKVRKDLTAERLADLIWDCWQGGLLRMKVENSVEPVTNSLQIMFQHMLLP